MFFRGSFLSGFCLLKRPLTALLMASLLAAPSFADINLPELGDVSQEGMTPRDEHQVGEAAVIEMRRSGSMMEDPEVTTYINQLGNRLVEATGTSLPFTFFVMNSPEVNAFALPGGFVAVYSGLIGATQHESELAAVMSHEISHVTQHHIARLIDAQRAMPWLTMAAMGLALLASRSGSGDLAMGALAASSGYAIQRQLDFTYAFEQEADRIGMQTLIKSGFDPWAMPTFFDRLQRYNRLVENNAPEFLRTHPVTYKRITDAQERLQDQPYKQVPDSADYLFVRERARVLQSDNKATVDMYKATLAGKRYGNLPAHLYGLALAQSKARDFDGAWLTLQKAHDAFGLARSHPALEYLGGSIRMGQGRYDEAIKLFREGERHFPGSRVLVYGEIDALIAARNYPDALKVAQSAQELYPSDAWLYQRQARIYEAQGQSQQRHRMQAEYYARLNEYGAAVEQLELAQRDPSNDFYLASSIDARLKELQSMRGEDKDKKR